MRFLYHFKTHKKSCVAFQLKNRYITLINTNKARAYSDAFKSLRVIHFILKFFLCNHSLSIFFLLLLLLLLLALSSARSMMPHSLPPEPILSRATISIFFILLLTYSLYVLLIKGAYLSFVSYQLLLIINTRSANASQLTRFIKCLVLAF